MAGEHESLISFVYRYLFGLPDGTFVRLRCRILGHSWSSCVDECCEGRTLWCGRCTATVTPEIDHVLRFPDGEEVTVSRHDFIDFIASADEAFSD